MDDTKLNQIANDIHFVTAPLHLVWRLIVISIGIAFAPAILLFLLVMTHFDVNPDYSIMKIVVGVFGPIVFMVWFAAVVRWCERDNPRYAILGEGGGRAMGLAGYFFFFGYVGVIASLISCAYFGIEGEVSLWVLVLGLFSPALLYAFGRIVRSAI